MTKCRGRKLHQAAARDIAGCAGQVELLLKTGSNQCRRHVPCVGAQPLRLVGGCAYNKAKIYNTRVRFSDCAAPGAHGLLQAIQLYTC